MSLFCKVKPTQGTMDKTTSSDHATVINGGGEEPAAEEEMRRENSVIQLSDSFRHASTDNIRQISVQSGSVIIETRPDAIVIHRGGGDVPCGDNILSALRNHIARTLADIDLTNIEQEDQPDGSRKEEQREETQPLVAGKTQQTNARDTEETAKNIRETEVHNHEQVGRVNVAETQSKMRHISVQAGSVTVGIVAMLLPSFWLSLLISYLISLVPGFDREALDQIDQKSASELPNLNE